MRYHKWGYVRMTRRKMIKFLFVIFLVWLFVLGIQKFDVGVQEAMSHGQAESIAIMQKTEQIGEIISSEKRNERKNEKMSFQNTTVLEDKKEYETGWKTKVTKQLVSSGWALVRQSGTVRDTLWELLMGILPENGYSHVRSGIPVLQAKDGHITKIVAEEEAYYASAWISDIWKHSFEKVGNLTLSEEVQVILYHTHNAETYLPDDGVSKVSGQNGGVVDAAKVFQEALQKKYGVRTAHSTTIHDYPDWNRSYQNSLQTATQLLQAYPSAKAIFDIHRDAGFTSKKATTAIVHGHSAAKIMMVIGCNHENWKENLAFARQLEAKCNELYPGLLRDQIRIKETGRYNQQVDPRAVLLEVGSDLNTRAEAEYAMECFAHVVYEVLNDLEN